MYDVVNPYNNRRKESDVADEDRLPFEASFGWVGRTQPQHHQYLNPDDRNDNEETVYSVPVYTENYPFQYFGDGVKRTQDSFNFYENTVTDEEGFGKDDLFYSRKSEDYSDRSNDDYEVSDYVDSNNYAREAEYTDYYDDVPVRPPPPSQGNFDDRFDQDDIFRSDPKPSISFGF